MKKAAALGSEKRLQFGWVGYELGSEFGEKRVDSFICWSIQVEIYRKCLAGSQAEYR